MNDYKRESKDTIRDQREKDTYYMISLFGQMENKNKNPKHMELQNRLLPEPGCRN